MSELCKLYSNRLTELGISIDKKINSTNLKDKILSAIPSLESYKIRQNVVLSFKQITGKALLDVLRNNNLSQNMITLIRAATIVRKTIFDASYRFQGSLKDKQYEKMPDMLHMLVDMILTGRDITRTTQSDENVCDAVSSLTQLLVFNTVKRYN